MTRPFDLSRATPRPAPWPEDLPFHAADLYSNSPPGRCSGRILWISSPLNIYAPSYCYSFPRGVARIFCKRCRQNSFNCTRGLVNSKVKSYSRTIVSPDRSNERWKGCVFRYVFREIRYISPWIHLSFIPLLNRAEHYTCVITPLYTPLPTRKISRSFGWFVFYETLMNRPYFKINFRTTWLEYFAAFHRRSLDLFYNSRVSAGSISLIVRITSILPRKIEAFSP